MRPPKIVPKPQSKTKEAHNQHSNLFQKRRSRCDLQNPAPKNAPEGRGLKESDKNDGKEDGHVTKLGLDWRKKELAPNS